MALDRCASSAASPRDGGGGRRWLSCGTKISSTSGTGCSIARLSAHSRQQGEGSNKQRDGGEEGQATTSTNHDDSDDSDHDSIQAGAEKGFAALSALPEDHAEQTMNFLAGNQHVNQQAVETLQASGGELVEGRPDMKFRILIMGKQGNGKTTLCNRVLGVELDDRGPGGALFGASSPLDHVKKEQRFPGINPDLVIHDSGGFENGSTEVTSLLQDFLSERNSRFADETQRIHCILYVIACNSSKAIHPIDERFLRNEFYVEGVPVFVVLTKYDELVEKAAKKLKRTPEGGAQLSEVEAERAAYQDFNEHTLVPLLELVTEAQAKHGMDIQICTVGLREDGDEFMPAARHLPTGLRNFGSVKLVQLMKMKVATELRPLLAAVQMADPKDKLAEAVAACTKLYWRAMVVRTVSVLPVLAVGNLATVYLLTARKAQRFWKIETEDGIQILPSSFDGSGLSLQTLLVQAIFDVKSGKELALLSAARLLDVGGPLAASKMARDIVAMVVGLNALLHDLWLVQHHRLNQVVPLSWEQLQKACREFQGSPRRERMMREIDGINTTNFFHKKVVALVAERAWKASVGVQLPFMQTSEKQRRQENAQWEAANPVGQ
ncbi:hypothetical protein B0T25DRAFT_221275 [Lasiosphaeria hispida]|uniref:G domain-containing protein n=1 Tax=Lasiosphaeria hispida TaxID=260671 RepID=A0AAJ0MET4_9PEZI|nr:hypothetical protein B0T25DRAFT_221275 [Lasiosphaeria hispida]